MSCKSHPLLNLVLAAFTGGAACGAMAPAAHAAVVYSNLGSSQDGSDPAFSYGPLADSFITGPGGGVLGGVQLLLTSLSSAFNGNLTVLLLSDAGNGPGTSLGSLGTLAFGNVSTSSVASYAFASAATISLAPNTRYWVELTSSAPNAIEWSWSDDIAALGVSGEYSYSAVLGVNANSAAAGPYQMAVQVAALPEPTSLMLVVAAAAAALRVRRSAMS